MNWTQAPVGMVRYDDFINMLVGLRMTGGCDPKTLAIIAQTVGVREYYEQELRKVEGARVVERPVFLLVD